MIHGESVRTGEDAVREIVAGLVPDELPALDAVLLAYRVEPWTPAPDDGLRTGPPPVAGVSPEQLGPFVAGFLGKTLAELPSPPARSLRSLLHRRRGPARPSLNAPMPAADFTTRTALHAAAYTAAIARGYSPEAATLFAAAVERAFQPR